MAMVGLQLYWAVGRAAAAGGWNWVPEMSDAFSGHDYCAGDPYLVRLESSFVGQGTIFGTAHPTRVGHATFANALLDAIVFRPEVPRWRVKLVVERVRVERGFRGTTLRAAPKIGPEQTGEPARALPPSDRYAFDFSVRTMGNWPGGIGTRFTIPKTSVGAWLNVPPDVGTFEFDVYNPPRPPRYPTSVDFLTYGPSGTLPGFYTSAQNFGHGCHESAHSGWAIRYRIEVTLVDGRPGVPTPSTLPACQEKKQ
jgi:hypothetical protein